MVEEGVVSASCGERAGSLFEVVAFAGEEVPYAAARVIDVAAVARDDVDVEVHDGLTGSFPGIDADVVAVGVELLIDLLLDDIDELEEGRALVGCGVEPSGDEAARDDEGVAGAYREAVAKGKGKGIARDPGGCGSFEERGGHRGGDGTAVGG